jgi:hypothetical protein
MTFECPPGTDIDYNNLVYGIMSPKTQLAYYCTEEAIRNDPKNDKIQKCTNYMNLDYIHS